MIPQLPFDIAVKQDWYQWLQASKLLYKMPAVSIHYKKGIVSFTNCIKIWWTSTLDIAHQQSLLPCCMQPFKKHKIISINSSSTQQTWNMRYHRRNSLSALLLWTFIRLCDIRTRNNITTRDYIYLKLNSDLIYGRC